nr:ribonuclease H-like domain-containing protein [Tanacetum cinerariifolium]
MRDEYNALIKNSTWTLVPRPSEVNVVRYMWLFCHKYLADSTFSCYKAWLVANGSTQLKGVDVDETFSLVIKPGTTRISVARDTLGMFLSQKKYAVEILEPVDMVNFNPCSLQYLTFTRPDISYAVQQLQRTKHIEIDVHFVWDLVAAGEVRVLHVPSLYQFADIFTKGLPFSLFEEFQPSLSICSPLALTAGEC